MDETGKVIEMSSARNDGLLAKLSKKLSRNKDGAVLPTARNAGLILAGDPAVRDMVGFDEFRQEPMMVRPPPPIEEDDAPARGPYPRPWGLPDLFKVTAYFEVTYSPRFKMAVIEQAMANEAPTRPFHRVREWLNGLTWDGVPRLDSWLSICFGATDGPYARGVGCSFMIGATRRIRHPGSKFDYLLILEGRQGIGKSTAVKELFGETVYSDSLPAALESRDAAIGLLGIWVLELAEIEQVVRAEVEIIKAFLSRSIDRYRPVYGRSYVDVPRQTVLVGTTNATDYLRDVSGNRRFWPVACQFVDMAWLRANREQLWAEAAARETTGEADWLSGVDAQEYAALIQDERMEEDVWTATVEAWLDAPLLREVWPSLVLTQALGIPLAMQDQRQKRRVNAILKRCGWDQNGRNRTSTGRNRVWTRAT